MASKISKRVWVYLLTVLVCAAMLLLRNAIAVSFNQRPLLILFMSPIIACALAGGLGPGLFATFICGLGTVFFSIPPRHSFWIEKPHDLLQWSFLMANGVLVSVLSEWLRRSRRQIAASQRLQAVTLASIGDGVIATDGRGLVTYLNPMAEQLTGWPNPEAKGLPLETIYRAIDEVHREPVPNSAQKVLTSGGKMQVTGEAILVSRDGRQRPVQESRAPIRLADGVVSGVVLVFRDETTRRQAESERELTAEALELINRSADSRTLLKAVIALLRRWSGCEAVAVRLRDGDDFPYYETSGLPEEMVLMENSLCARSPDGAVLRDSGGSPILACLCGDLLQGRFDATQAFFTDRGSFWSNCAAEVLAELVAAGGLAGGRNRCIAAGYRSMALIPLRSHGKTFGLMQFSDTRAGQFSLEKIALFERLGENIANFLSRVQLEERLKESEAKLRAIGDNLPDGYVYQYAYDPEGQPRFLYVSAGVQQVHGLSPQAVMQDANLLHDQIDPAQLPSLSAAEKTSAVEMSDFSMDLHMRGPDGQWRWINTRSRPTRRADGSVVWDGVASDITARRQTEMQLSKLSRAVEQTEAAVMVTDTMAHIEYVNPAFTKITGYTLAEALGKTPTILKSGKMAEDVYRNLWQTITTGRDWRGVMHNRRKDGTLFWARTVVSAIRDAAGAITHYVAVNEDITDQKALEDKLHQSQKMESIGRLAGGVAHDYNNMLSVILGNTELALDKIDPSQPLREELEEIYRAARRSADITRQLLAFARQQTIAPKPLNLNDTLEESLKMLRRLIGEDIELAWRPAPELWKVKIDPSQIDQLLANLVVNARDAIAGIGRITIKTTNIQVDETQCARQPGSTPGEYVMLTVSDTGSGMRREVLERIFEPFYTTKGTGKGTGLGLATVYGIVNQNMGFVDVESEPGRGTVFKIYLPRFVETAKTRSEKNEREPKLPRGSETVLLVEDEEAILRLGKRFIERLGYTVLTANSPEAALGLAESHTGNVDLLVTDLIMPRMNGRELAARLTRQWPNLKCLYMSGYPADIIAQHKVLEEGIHFLPKPFSIKEIAIKVRQALEG